MTAQWTDWQPLPADARSPYVDWWMACPPPEFRRDLDAVREKSLGYSYFTLGGSLGLASLETGQPLAALMPEADWRDSGAMTKFDRDFGFGAGKGPLPAKAHNDAFDDHLGKNGWNADPASLPAVRLDTVIVGVIDSGIALGNSRFRESDGGTRILASWQQDSRHKPDQPFLPFGSELYKRDIDALIADHSVGGCGGFFLEDDFNRAADLVDMRDLLGNRELARRAAHGTFVADLAAGADPQDADPRIKILAVNLPNRATINNSGIFLDYFAIYAIRRIATLADQIWEKSIRDAGGDISAAGAAKGFPIVVNLSFGKNAGAKDGEDEFGAALRELNATRRKSGYGPIHVVIPVGNHNLEQGNACIGLTAGAKGGIGFRVQPGDASSNYLEIWSDVLPNPGLKTASEAFNPLEVAIVPPGGTAVIPSSGGHGCYRSLRDIASPGEIARLYSGVRMAADRRSYRVWYLLCTAPTIQHEGRDRGSPSGCWSIAVRNRSESGDTIRVFLSAQTDQSVQPQGATGLLPRLETGDYRRFLDDGRPRDSYLHPYDPAQPDQETSKTLRRHGSINATAMSRGVIAIAGHRLSDGRPALYSATGSHPDTPAASPGRAHPSVSFGTDDGYAHFGVLGAGAASGSVVAMRGTSFAAAQATRALSLRLKDSLPEDFDAETWLGDEGRAAEQARRNWPGGQPPATKIGGGRMAWSRLRAVDRFG
ncbi:MAG: hypothetical protein K2Z25_05625 [Beijerinckiaceae bacterium]|nr:hypothetical protein [Beijerinckiaceae bacterium]